MHQKLKHQMAKQQIINWKKIQITLDVTCSKVTLVYFKKYQYFEMVCLTYINSRCKVMQIYRFRCQQLNLTMCFRLTNATASCLLLECEWFGMSGRHPLAYGPMAAEYASRMFWNKRTHICYSTALSSVCYFYSTQIDFYICICFVLYLFPFTCHQLNLKIIESFSSVRSRRGSERISLCLLIALFPSR